MLSESLTPFENNNHGTIMNIECRRGVTLSVIEGMIGWTFAVGIVYLNFVIAFSL
tara:strand:+ start:5081 stop:5245 length:165 start_codon:yes stop_codon:yes gene_type:complete